MKSDKDISVNRLNANPQNGQTHSNDLPANSQRIGWVCLTILWGLRLES